MSDPSERDKADPHPVSSHRTPQEIAEDEVGPIGNAPHQRRRVRFDDGQLRKLEKAPKQAEDDDPETRRKSRS